MKSKCPNREDVFALSQGMLAEQEAKRVKAHLEDCADCRNVCERYLRLDSVLDGWAPSVEPSPWFDARLRAALASAKPASEPAGFGLWTAVAWPRWLALSAFAALLLAGAVVTRHNLRLQHQRSAPVAVQIAQTEKPAAVQSDAAQELKMYQNLPVLEDYDMLANFDVISELPKGSTKVAD
jgi:anti-sigma-K factor RskA